MKLYLSLVLLSILTLVGCDGFDAKKSASSEIITFSEMSKIGAFHRAFDSHGRDSYSPEMLIQVEGNQLTISTIHPNPKHEVIDSLDGGVRIVEVYEIQKNANGMHLSKLIKLTNNCSAISMKESTNMTIGFKRDGENNFTAVIANRRWSGFTKATPEQIEKINAVPECSDSTETPATATPPSGTMHGPPEPDDAPVIPGSRPGPY